MDKQDFYRVSRLVAAIEEQLGWGKGAHWSNKDFEKLGDRIFGATKKKLSVTTLKRIWGRAELIANPSPATLDILSEFAGHENWRDFLKANGIRPEQKNGLKKGKRTALSISIVLLAAIALLGAVRFWPQDHGTALNKNDFAFTSRATSDELPNSVVFEYDASVIEDGAKLEIQQSWDDTKRIAIDKNDSIATCIYYRPGFFKSKLVVDGTIVKENDVFIKTQGWLGTLETDPVPIYLSPKEIVHGRTLTLAMDTLAKYGMDPKTVRAGSGLYYIADFEGLHTDDFELSMRIKHDVQQGLGGCKRISTFILYDGGAIGIPLAKRGCISTLALMGFGNYLDGKKNDLSSFGVDFDDFVEVRCVSKANRLKIYVDDRLAHELPVPETPLSIKGISVHFEAAGSLKDVVFKNSAGTVYDLAGEIGL